MNAENAKGLEKLLPRILGMQRGRLQEYLQGFPEQFRLLVGNLEALEVFDVEILKGWSADHGVKFVWVFSTPEVTIDILIPVAVVNPDNYPHIPVEGQ